MKFEELEQDLLNVIRKDISRETLLDVIQICRKGYVEMPVKSFQIALMASNIASGLVTYANGDYKKVALLSVDIAEQIISKVENKKL